MCHNSCSVPQEGQQIWRVQIKKRPLEGKGFASNAANMEQGGGRKVVIEDLACQLPSS